MNATATTFTVYRVYDPELLEHNSSETMARYGTSRDEKILEIPSTARPMRFHCRVLTREQRNRVRELPSVEQRREMAFRYGVLDVQNALVNGTPTNVAANRGKADELLSNDALDALGVGDLDIAEIGEVIIARSFLAAGIEPRFAVLPSSEHAYGMAMFHLAERKAEQSTQTDESQE